MLTLSLLGGIGLFFWEAGECPCSLAPALAGLLEPKFQYHVLGSARRSQLPRYPFAVRRLIKFNG
jgi:hypothetical protein